jgi:hypothetical protein
MKQMQDKMRSLDKKIEANKNEQMESEKEKQRNEG